MARHLGAIVKAGTAAEPGQSWVSSIGCTRRPGRKPCPGQIGIRRSELPPAIRWECIVCGDEGTISGWEGSYADLRCGAALSGAEGTSLVMSCEIAEVLRSLTFPDSDVERLVYRATAVADGVALEGQLEILHELADTVAVESNHEVDRRRRKRLDEVFSVLVDALNPPQANAGLVGDPAESVRLRLATPDDFDAVLELWRVADAEPTHTDNVESLTRLLERDPFALLIAEEGGRVVGSVICGWDGWRGSIYRLAVAPTHRRLGLARRMTAAAEEHLHAFGAVRLQAVITETSPAAVGFWTASGWQKQFQRARFVKG